MMGRANRQRRAFATCCIAVVLFAGCATSSIELFQGQTADQATQTHEACFEATHSYWKQTGWALLFLPAMYLEKDKQNLAYEECMWSRGYKARYSEGMGYRPNVDILPAIEPYPSSAPVR